MSTTGAALTTWEQFVALPDDDDVYHQELRDGEVVVVPPPKPIHTYIQLVLVRWLNEVAGKRGVAGMEFPYRPAADMQFWYADVAYMPREDSDRLRTADYMIYSPALIVEVLSPSNRPAKVRRQRTVAFSGGTREFWVIDPLAQTIEVTVAGSQPRLYSVDQEVPVSVLPGVSLPVRILFEPRPAQL